MRETKCFRGVNVVKKCREKLWERDPNMRLK